MALILAFLLALSLTAFGWVLLDPAGRQPSGFHQAELVLSGEAVRAGRLRSPAELIRSLGLVPPPNSPLHRDLALTGFSLTVEELYLYKMLAAGAGLLLAALVAATGEGTIALILLVMGLAAWSLPDARIRADAKKVRAAVSRQLPPFLQALAMMTEAGMNLHPAILAYAQQNHTELGRELQLAMAEAQMGAPLAEALLRLASRCDVPELYRAVAALVQASERGGAGIAETCRQLAAEAWAKRRDMAREMGQKAAAKMFLPILLLVLPTLFLFMIGPAFYSMMVNF